MACTNYSAHTRRCGTFPPSHACQFECVVLVAGAVFIGDSLLVEVDILVKSFLLDKIRTSGVQRRIMFAGRNIGVFQSKVGVYCEEHSINIIGVGRQFPIDGC